MKYTPKQSGSKFTIEIINFLRENTKGKSNIDLSKMVFTRFGVLFSVLQINKAKWRHGITGSPSGLRGGRSNHAAPLFYERMDSTGFILIKISNTGTKNQKWKLKHHWLYEKAYGEIPKGHQVIFLDKNKNNFELNNLALVTINEKLKLSQLGLWFNNTELTKTGLAIVRHKENIHSKLFEALGQRDKNKYFRKIYKQNYLRKRKQYDQYQ